MLRALCIAAICSLYLPGCVVVVDHDSETHWVHEDYPSHGRIDIYLEQPDSTLASQLNIDRDRTCVVDRVAVGSPADRAGLKPHDVITSVDGDAAASVSRVRQAIRSHRPGEQVSLGIVDRKRTRLNSSP